MSLIKKVQTTNATNPDVDLYDLDLRVAVCGLSDG
jgi:hypothetical protein